MVDLTRPLRHLLLSTALFVALWSAAADAEALNDYILDYQPLTFNPYHLTEKHERVKRNADPFLRWNFRAYGRTFNLQLQPAESMFAPGHHLVVDDAKEDFVDTSHIYEGKLTEPAESMFAPGLHLVVDDAKEDFVNTSHIYEGKLTGDPTSHVHMSIDNGTVLGFINIPGHAMYHMEPAKKYFHNATFPSIIYPETKMNMDPYRHKRAAHASNDGSCFSQSLYDKLKSMSQPVDSVTGRKLKKRDLSPYEMENPFAKYTAGLNDDSESLHRYKRDLRDGERTCFMSLRADKILYDHVLKEQGSASKAKEALLSMFAIHISALNSIYESTTFKYIDSATPMFRGVRFQLQRSTIITECTGDPWSSGYCTDNLDVSNFLDLTSLENHDAFCLVHTFTYRDFAGGTLGLAWVATPDSRASGVCGIFGRVSDNGKITQKSLNTGITTLINFGQEVASRVSQLTFAHEVGHNFGANHDKTSQCAPYGTSRSDASKGNYIMYPSANSGNLPHNDQFSVCSKDYIAKVLNGMGTPGGRKYCFKSSETAFCGNKIVETGEGCDCGYEDECDDQCCVGRPDNDNSDIGCKRKPNLDCSPTQGPCCGADCKFTGSGVCSAESDCLEQSSCLPNTPTCPKPTWKADYENFCSNFDRVCQNGSCIGSVCGHINWVECFMKESQVSDKEEMCYVSCQKDASSECVSSYDAVKIEKVEFKDFKDLLVKIQQGKKEDSSTFGVQRPAGSTCNYGKGYCDVFSKCRNYDAEGPFKQLTDLIFNEVTFENIEEWIVDHWWAVLLMCIGVIIFMAVFVKVFGYNTPSEDPKKKRRAQPMPRVNPNAADKRSANNQYRGGQGGKRGGEGGGGGGGGGGRGGAAYATDVPMHHSQPYGGGGGRGGQLNQGYDSYQDYNPYHHPQPGSRGGGGGTHQQFDRIAAPRRY